jgi:hypothetical protein
LPSSSESSSAPNNLLPLPDPPWRSYHVWPHGQTPGCLHDISSDAKASPGYPPVAKSAAVSTFRHRNERQRPVHSSTCKARACTPNTLFSLEQFRSDRRYGAQAWSPA